MNIAEISTQLTRATGAGTTDYTAADRIVDINNAYYRVAALIFASQDESDFDDPNHGDYPDLTTPLVAGQRDYPIPTSEKVVSIKKVSISYDGSTVYTAMPIDSGETTLPGNAGNATAEATLDGYFSKTSPRYDYRNGAIFIYPRADASDENNNGYIYTEWSREVSPFTTSDLTAGTREPGVPSAYHRLIVLYAAMAWCADKKKDRIPALLNEAQILERMLQSEMSRKVRDRRMNIVSKLVSYK